MHLGIKIGPQHWRDKLEPEPAIRRVEVFFDLARQDAYPPMFSTLQDRGIQAGLHASTLLPGGIYPNLATADGEVRRASVDLLERTIDVAAANHMRFVVFHPGSFRIPALRAGRVVMLGRETPAASGQELLRHETVRLTERGRARGVEVWAENLPGLEFAAYGPPDREQTTDPLFVPHQAMLALGEAGTGLCLDLGHLCAEMSALGLYGEGAWEQVEAISRRMAPHVRHLHLSTVAPPFNGTDSHHGFLAEDYALGAAPDAGRAIAWLGLFADRDLWVIPEPDGGADVHLANYRQIASWMEQFR